MAAILAAGEGARLCGQSMAEHLGFRPLLGGPIEVVIPAKCSRRVEGVIVHRFDVPAAHQIEHDGIPGVSSVIALLALAPRLSIGDLERAINQADAEDVIDPETLRGELDAFAGRKGVVPLRDALDRRTFAMSRSELERRFRPIARRAGLPKPETCVKHNCFEVDFLWRELGLVVETDGLRYHRTPAQQQRDRLRDQAHQAVGDTPVRFTHGQVRYDPAHVEQILRRVTAGLNAKRGTSQPQARAERHP
jgi:very-short-patch-repair endonuclease